jgi:Spy/CpxP family protein refolding chaperone
MNYFSKYRYAILTIIVLGVIIVTAIITSLIYNNGFKNDMPKQVHFHDVKKMLHDELGLSREQDIKIEFIQKDFKNSAHPIIKDLEEKRLIMTKELSAANPDTVVLFKLSEDIGNLHNRLKQVSLKHLLMIRAICNPQQIQKLNLITMRLLEPEGVPGKKEERRQKSVNSKQ